jgi:hypothetical protein
MTVGIAQASELAALKALLADGSPLLLNADQALGYGIDTAYIAAGTVTVTRSYQVLPYPERDVKIDFQVVARPVGGTRAAVTWASESAKYATWASIPAGTTWAQIAAGG